MTITDAQIEAAFLVALAEAKIPPDVGELLVRGNPTLGVAPGALRKALVAAERAAWRPIEEAPRDGTPILVTGGAKHGQQVNCVPADGGWWRMQIGQLSTIPTHFRPLPTPGEPDE